MSVEKLVMSSSKNYLSSILLLILVSAGIFLIPVALVSGNTMKCWRNNENVLECGEIVPPEYIQKGYREISSQGFLRGERKRAPTPEELEEAKRLAIIQAEEEARQREIESQDRALLATFGSVKDIDTAERDLIAVIDSNIHLTNQRIENKRKTLDERTDEVVQQELAGKKPADNLLKQIEALQQQVALLDKAIEDAHEERQSVKEEYALKRRRLTELLGQEEQRKNSSNL